MRSKVRKAKALRSHAFRIKTPSSSALRDRELKAKAIGDIGHGSEVL